MTARDQQTGSADGYTTRPVYYGLDSFFKPRSIVLIDAAGQSESISDAVWQSMTGSFDKNALSRISVTSPRDVNAFADLSPKADLAIIVTPTDWQIDLACACDEKGIRAALLMSAEGHEPDWGRSPWQPGLVESRCRHGLRILGPQSFGLISPYHSLNITAGLKMPRSGKIAFLSQSGAMCASVLDWSFRTSVGFSAMVSCEVMTDVAWADLITHFGDDPRTKSIVIYLETVGDPRSFLSAAREVALSKPIILLKSGLAESPGMASPSEADTREDKVLNAALQRVGVLRVRTISEMFNMANILATQPLPRGPRLTILTNSMAPALLATDALHASGGKLATLQPDTRDIITKIVSEGSPCSNPVHILADADADRYEAVMQELAEEPDSDGMLVILTPQPGAQPGETAWRVVNATARLGKPVLAGWMGGDSVAEGRNILFQAGIPAFPYPDTPARLFALMWRHARNLNGIYETPSVIVDEQRAPVDTKSAGQLLSQLREQGVTELSADQSAALLRLYGIPVAEDTSTTPNDYELIAGSRIDPLFGPVIYFGVGGRMSRVINDMPIGLPPLTSALVLRMMERSRTWQLLKPDDSPARQHRLAQLQALLVRLSQLVVQQPVIRALEITPLLATADAIRIPSAKIILHDPSKKDGELPRPAIRPYPVQYIWTETIRNGSEILIRPVRPEDEPLIIEFHKTLSEETIYRRYFFQHKFSRRTSHERLRRTCFLDFDREIALAAVVNADGKDAVIAGVGRLSRNRAGDSAEIALVVSDAYQSQGIGTYLLSHLVDIARAESIGHIEGTMLPGNIHMQHLFGKLGFGIAPGADDTVVAQLRL